MRSSKRLKAQKKPYKSQRYKNKSKRNWRWNNGFSRSGLFLDDINEAIRKNKSYRAEGKGRWRIMPRDSCEVYKERKKRAALNRKRTENSDDTSYNKESRVKEVNEKEVKKLRSRKKTVKTNKSELKKKSKKRSPSCSSSSSYTTSSRCQTCSDRSQMDYD